jgi:CheY-like chemotaxis protein
MDGSPLALDSVIANQELRRRRPRHPMPDVLDEALVGLARDLATSPRQVLQKLSDTALELCYAQSSGISLLEEENGRQIFRWHAVCGQWASYLWATMPREFSPCGTVLDRKAAQLMILPERHFTPLAQVTPRVHEALLIPFSVRGEIVGTLWVIAHDENRRFDSEDRRVLSKLASFAAEAYERLSSLSADDVMQLSRLRTRPRLYKARRAAVQKRVLVVDDDVDGAASLALLLRQMGHEVSVAHDGAAALNAAARVRPDIVILDIAMPGMSSYEVAARLRQRLGAAVLIVALSGFGRDEDRAKALESGFDQHLLKPVDPTFLKSLLG